MSRRQLNVWHTSNKTLPLHVLLHEMPFSLSAIYTHNQEMINTLRLPVGFNTCCACTHVCLVGVKRLQFHYVFKRKLKQTYPSTKCSIIYIHLKIRIFFDAKIIISCFLFFFKSDFMLKKIIEGLHSPIWPQYKVGIYSFFKLLLPILVSK